VSGAIAAGTLVVHAAGTREDTAEVQPGPYYVFYLCAGHGELLIRLSTNNSDSGKLVRCTDPPQVQSLEVGLGDEFYLAVLAQDGAGGVFRWQLTVASR
jgi:hypothetical protein